jgi:tetratricopeptide (TPR) repeat protein
MGTPLKTLAVNYALTSDWKQAVEINARIISENPNDIDSLNRLGFAYMKIGKYNKAKETYKKVVEIDETNPIALKNLKRLDSIPRLKKQKDNGQLKNAPQALTINAFIEEAGRTKTVDLKNIADKKTLSFIEPGDTVSMVIKRSKIFIQTSDKKYIGMLPDNISARLIKFIKGGNQYSACIKACDDKNVKIFMKETKKANRFRNQMSFLSSFTSTND